MTKVKGEGREAKIMLAVLAASGCRMEWQIIGEQVYMIFQAPIEQSSRKQGP